LRRAFEYALETLKPAGAEVATLDAVHEEQQFPFVAETTQAEQIVGSCWCHAAFALNALNHNRNGRRRDCSSHRFEHGVRHLAESRHHWLESFLYFFLPRRGDAGKSPTMKGVDSGQDFEATFVVAESSGELEQTFVHFDAAVAEETFAWAD